MRILKQCAGIAAALLVAASAFSQPYPARTVTFVVGFAAGGGADLVARTLAEEMGKVLGRQIIVENRPGAGGTIGAEFVVRAAPDGYTLFVGGLGPNATAHSLYPNLKYDSLRDFSPISFVTENANALSIHTSVPAKTVSQLIDLARRNPRQLTYGSAGNGSAQHMSGELFKSMAKIDILHVPYSGVAAGLNDVLAGRIEMMFPPIFNAAPLAKAGRLRVLGVTTVNRAAVLPDVPTVAEAGLPGYEQTVWNALLAPAATPRDIISALNQATRKAVASEDLKRKFESQGATPSSSTPEQLAAYMKKEIDKYGRLIKAAGVKLD